MSHTEGPWSYKANGKYAELLDSKGLAIGAGDYDGLVSFDLECARRIVACVNACAGISNDILEKHGAVTAGKCSKALYENFLAVTAQRDELLSALKAIYDRKNAETMAQARNVIAKCEAQS